MQNVRLQNLHFVRDIVQHLIVLPDRSNMQSAEGCSLIINIQFVTDRIAVVISLLKFLFSFTNSCFQSIRFSGLQVVGGAISAIYS